MTLRRLLEIVGVDISKEKVQEVLDYQIEFKTGGRVFQESLPIKFIDLDNNKKVIVVKYSSNL